MSESERPRDSDGPTSPASPTSMDRLDAAALSAGDVYRLMTDLVTPRPIAWVSTLAEDGRPNLAPFSYFQAVCSRPPMVMLSIATRPDGHPKDTLANILATRELTINHVSEPLSQAMNATSAELPAEVDEWELAGEPGARLPSRPAAMVRPPRVASARAAMECRMTHALPLGHGPKGPSSTLVLAEVLVFWVAPGLIRRDERGRLSPMDPADLGAIGRLGGMSYARTRDTFVMPRPGAGSGSHRPPKP
ncbi:flavin reductase family protein [Paraliomyxa miuraensis]|uniref:flavin reductase family protein n=1 Tax=Paraliomyxa miuraensis TaxID=376150 RepID=UPI00225BF9AC|nr:flavin reductase family protein [Paraliomyxa miuraensis]MCX4245669.1 flavin reductase family protein [Paraliomyxa miuraensis]